MRHFTPTDFHHAVSSELDLHQVNVHRLLFRVTLGRAANPTGGLQRGARFMMATALRTFLITEVSKMHRMVKVQVTRTVTTPQVGTYHPSVDHQMIYNSL